jgi:choline dehydrogenase-like flavoprotein
VDNAVAARVLVDESGRANGVQYFNRLTKEEYKVYGKRVIVAASTIDSTRILLNSKSAKYPNGIANSNDVIGRYLTEQIRFHMYGFVPELLGGPTQNDDGIGGEHVYLPRAVAKSKRPYLRGFGMQFWSSGAQANAAFGKRLPGFGLSLKQQIKKKYPALVALHPYGEVLPRKDNRVTVDESRLDQYGVPIPKISYKIGENERSMAKDMYDTAEEILHAAKAEILPFERGSLDVAGSAIHEHGTCRMGSDPKTSALNGFLQSHEVPNLFVVDGAAFPTPTEKNPTLTILALTWRATDYMAEEMRAGRI